MGSIATGPEGLIFPHDEWQGMASATARRMVESLITPSTASHFADLKVPDEVQDRLDLLSEKNSDGTITPGELAEYEEIVVWGELLAQLSLQARAHLAGEAL